MEGGSCCAVCARLTHGLSAGKSCHGPAAAQVVLLGLLCIASQPARVSVSMANATLCTWPADSICRRRRRAPS